MPGYEVAKGVTLLRALPVWSERVGLSGKCDIVEAKLRSLSTDLKSEISNLKSLKPVEFKLGKRRKWENDDAQLCAQALCLEEMFGVAVPRGAVFHADSKRRREVEFTSELRKLTENAVAGLHDLLRESEISNLKCAIPRLPPAVCKPACEECSLFEVCLPKATGADSRATRLARDLFQIWNLRFEIPDSPRSATRNAQHSTIQPQPNTTMTYERFEHLPVWQTAAELYELTEELLENEAFKASRGFRDQLDRAALSVSNNIAEGFERGTTNELLAFLYIARGSAGEVRSMLCLKERRATKAGWPADLKSQISNLKSLAESCSRQLRAWADSLQNSDIKGQRHLSERERERFEGLQRAHAMQKKLLRNLPPGHPLRKDAEERGLI